VVCPKIRRKERQTRRQGGSSGEYESYSLFLGVASQPAIESRIERDQRLKRNSPYPTKKHKKKKKKKKQKKKKKKKKEGFSLKAIARNEESLKGASHALKERGGNSAEAKKSALLDLLSPQRPDT